MPAVAVIHMGQAFIGMNGCKGTVDGFNFLVSKNKNNIFIKELISKTRVK